jgi:acetolactate synthase-1/2/3 large subunit
MDRERTFTQLDLTVASWTAAQFRAQGITRIFMYPGGTIAPLVNACLAEGIQVERFASEQGAGYAALAQARLTNQPQVFMVTSGPGLTNAISPLADAYYDSLPLILVAGQIGTKDLSSRSSVRQRGFQEVPTVELTRPIAKHAVCLDSVQKVFEELPNAFGLASQGRMGPVVLDFPMDIQRTQLAAYPDDSNSEPHPLAVSAQASKFPDSTKLADLASALSFAKRPVILLGQGAHFAGAYSAYSSLAEKADALVVTSFLGIGSFDTLHPRCIGYVGHTGHASANTAVHEADLVLVLGSRLDVRQTGTVTDKFVPNGKIAWVDVDQAELDNPRVKVDWTFHCDLGIFVNALLSCIPERCELTDIEWKKRVAEHKTSSVEDRAHASSPMLQPKTVLAEIAPRIAHQNVIVSTGVGCHQHWAARHLPFAPSGPRLLTSGGHGTMGFDLPSAIGAAMAAPEAKVLCVVGDGSLLMNLQELMSLSERNLNVKILVMNNHRLGIVSQFQLITWGDDPASGRFHSPDFARIAEGFGIRAWSAETMSDIKQIMPEFWDTDGPALLDMQMDPESDVVPMLLAGQTMDAMWSGRNG